MMTGVLILAFNFAPGTERRESQRNLWFDTIERLNIDPWSDDIFQQNI